MNFVDQVELTFVSGDGGDGLMHFRREKYRPKGGPDGGDGGRGGSVILKASSGKQTLAHLAGLHTIKADNGTEGQTNLKSGKSAADIYIQIPEGTELLENGRAIKDFTEPQEEFLVVKGGKGGRGNWHFKTAVNQAPRRFEVGVPGESKKLTLKLKLIADIGLVGQPNSGKSSLLNTLTRADSKVGNYPFTTVQPHLGVIKKGDWERIIADLPGIIEGAAKGKGLGHEFLSHIERTKVLLLCLPADSLNIIEEYKILKKELVDYSPLLEEKPKIIVITKSDLSSAAELKKHIGKLAKQTNLPVMATSSLTGKGLTELVLQLQKSTS